MIQKAVFKSNGVVFHAEKITGTTPKHFFSDDVEGVRVRFTGQWQRNTKGWHFYVSIEPDLFRSEPVGTYGADISADDLHQLFAYLDQSQGVSSIYLTDAQAKRYASSLNEVALYSAPQEMLASC